MRGPGRGLWLGWKPPQTAVFVPADSRAFFTANGGFLILFLFSLPSGRRDGVWWWISESVLSGISTTTHWRIGLSPEKEQNFLCYIYNLSLQNLSPKA